MKPAKIFTDEQIQQLILARIAGGEGEAAAITAFVHWAEHTKVIDMAIAGKFKVQWPAGALEPELALWT